MKKLVIISGVSGAGKTTASNYLEDKGYRCIDQYPPELLKELINLIDNDDSFKYQNVVLTISPFDLDKAVTLLTNTNFKVTLILIDADKETIINRYKFTRRIHPLLTNNVADTLSEALDIEKNILYKYKDRGFLINTTNLPVRAFQDQINRALNDIEDKNLSLSFVSFGFKNGIPKDCDVIFDVRFLDNPFYVEDLKEKTGNDAEVRDFVLNSKMTQEYIAKLIDYVDFMLKAYDNNGDKRHLTICVGCTGGQHRSVAFAHRLAQDLKNDWTVNETHRDKDRRKETVNRS